MEVRGAFTHLGQSLAQSREEDGGSLGVFASLRLCARYDLRFDLRETTTQGARGPSRGERFRAFPGFYYFANAQVPW